MTRALIIAMLVLSMPSTASALQLRWASGQHNITFTEAMTCTLIVSSDADEITLPQQWHLLWVARNCPSLSARLDTTLSDSSTAHVCASIKSTPAEEHAHLSALELRAACRSFATSARYILDLPAGSAGTLQAVGTLYSVDLPEEALLLRSPLAIFNGGAGVPLPTAIITARSEHMTTELTISAKGTDMSGIVSAELVAPDVTWSIPLTIVSQSDTTLHAHADIPTNVPASVLRVTRAGGTTSASSLAVAACDQPVTNAFPQGNGMLFLDPDPTASTKDFALYHNTVSAGGNKLRDLFHLYYIRRLASGLEPCLAHAWSQDLTHWKVDIATSSSALYPSKDLGDPTIPVTVWDRVNVWAPSIVTYQDSTYMFYVGVDINNDQRIGYATTGLLDTCNTRWTRRPSFVLSADSSVWATRNRPPGLGQQFRDPCVFAHPNPDSAAAGKFFMVYTAMNNPTANVFNSAVGLARNLTPGSMQRWVDLGFYRSTVPSITGFSGLEGPIMFQDMGSPRGWLCMMTNASNSASGTSSARFVRQTPGFGPQDLDLTTPLPASDPIWPTTPPPALYAYTNSDPTVFGWNGTEYLRISDQVQYLAGFTAWGPVTQGIEIARLSWNTATTGRDFTLAPSAVAAVDLEGVPSAGIQLHLIEQRPTAGRISWLISTPRSIEVRLEIYDIAGRRVRSLLHSRVPAGTTAATWDTFNSERAAVHSGVYFARLAFDGGARVAPVHLSR